MRRAIWHKYKAALERHPAPASFHPSHPFPKMASVSEEMEVTSKNTQALPRIKTVLDVLPANGKVKAFRGFETRRREKSYILQVSTVR